MQKINSLDELRSACEIDQPRDFFISLAGGMARSSKSITIDDHGLFHVMNEIDGSVQSLNPETIFSQSNIGEAISKGALYTY